MFRKCPLDLKEAISSVCFAAPRCADLPELLQVQSLFASKYGKDFVSAATDLTPDCSVNGQVPWIIILETTYNQVPCILFIKLYNQMMTFACLLKILQHILCGLFVIEKEHLCVIIWLENLMERCKGLDFCPFVIYRLFIFTIIHAHIYQQGWKLFSSMTLPMWIAIAVNRAVVSSSTFTGKETETSKRNCCWA